MRAGAWTCALCAALLATGTAAGQEEAAVLPRDLLFAPLIADPRWPHFSAAWQFYGGDEVAPSGGELDDVGAVAFGDTFTFYREPLAGGGAWSVGLQAAVNSIFDLNADSRDLVNADYFVAVPVMWRDGAWSGMARAFHASSHLGDEFLLRTQVERVNLSVEGIDLKLSRRLAGGVFRLYGGGGYLAGRDPDTLAPWMAQAGVEYRSPTTFLRGRLRPVAGFDFQGTEETGWDLDSSVRAGIQLEGEHGRSTAVQLLFEYYDGRNPNGQFYDRPVDWWGIGLHAYF